MIAAILRAQFLSMRLGGNRGAIFSVITAMVWYTIWVIVACAACLMAAGSDLPRLRLMLPIGLLAVCAYWQLMPIVSASMGSGLDMRKLVVYPVPHRKLFLVEILLRLTAGIEMLMVLAGIAAGVAMNSEAGGGAVFPRLLLAALLFALFNVLLASGFRSVLERLLARRRVRELLAILMAMVWVLPRFLISAGYMPKKWGSAGAAIGAIGLPWTVAAHLMVPRAAGESILLAMISLFGWTVAAAWFGRAQFERGLRYDAVAAQATPLGNAPGSSTTFMERVYRLPSLLWHDPLAGIVEKELRSLARTPRFRMVFVMGFTFGLMVWFPIIAGRRSGQTAAPSPYFLVVVCVYALTLLGQVSYWNSFGFDRSAAAFYFAAPVSISRVLVGKNIAALCFIYVEVLILCGVTAVFHLNKSWQTSVESIVVIGICSLYMLALGNISSVHYPRALSPERVAGSGGRGFQGFLFLMYPLALVPVFLAYLARYAFNSELAFAIGLAIAAILGGVLYAMALQSSASNAVHRREEIVQELSKSQGPITAE
jgi:ABC-2 type transport system permease protein